MRIAQDLSISQVRKTGKSLTVRSAARFTLVDLAGRGSGPTVVTRANVATLLPGAPDSGWRLPLSKPTRWQNGGKMPQKGGKMATVAFRSISRMQSGPNSGSLQDGTSEGLPTLETGAPTSPVDAGRTAPTRKKRD